MSKLKNQKINPLDKVAEDIQKLTEEYDEGSMIYDPLSNEFMTEGQHKIRYDNTPKANKQLQQHLTRNSNQMQKQKEYFKKAKIEEKNKIKKPIAQRTEPFKTKRDTQVPLKFETAPLPNFYKIKNEKDDTLKKIEQERNKPDKDFYKGLGTFFLK